MFITQDALIGIYSSSSTALGPLLTGFTVTTNSGTISVNWGDSLSDTLASGVPKNHQFLCALASAPAGFWNNIQPCVS